MAHVMDATGTAGPHGDHRIRAPELFTGGRASVSSDIYSSAVTLYALVAGHLPFDGFTLLADLEAAVLAGDCLPIRDVAPHVSPALADRINKGMSIDPAGRFTSATEFDNALSLPSRSRRFTPTPPHSGHERCWLIDGRGGSLNLCVSNGTSVGLKAFETRHAASGNRVKKHCGIAKVKNLPTQLRKAFNSLRH